MRRLGHHQPILHLMFSALITRIAPFVKATKLTLVCLILLVSLSALPGSASFATASGDVAIPADAIRIRIIANSDSAFDQQVKRDVRDQVAAVIESWGVMPATHDEARTLIEARLSEIQETADTALAGWQVSYGAHVELAEVPFPAKMFQRHSYDAGQYEALRLTLGGGQGANWWCVLFPPLCLTAATAPDDKPKAASTARSTTAHNEKPGKTAASSKKPTHTSTQSSKVAEPADTDAGKPEPRFFLWELLQKLGDFLRALFS